MLEPFRANDTGAETDTGTDSAGGNTVQFAAPWPDDLDAVFTKVFEDATDDQVALPVDMAGPPYSGPVPFPPADVRRVSVGVDGRFLYMRVDYLGSIPIDVVHQQPSGEIEDQWVKDQGMNIAMNVDGDIDTGADGEGVHGIDIFFAVAFDFGMRAKVYANWDFPDGDVHHHQNHSEGELGIGGPGYDYAVVRYDTSTMGAFFPRGATVDVGSWSEAESFDADGSLKYHHFAFDRVIDGGTWTIPGA